MWSAPLCPAIHYIHRSRFTPVLLPELFSQMAVNIDPHAEIVTLEEPLALLDTLHRNLPLALFS